MYPREQRIVPQIQGPYYRNFYGGKRHLGNRHPHGWHDWNKKKFYQGYHFTSTSSDRPVSSSSRRPSEVAGMTSRSHPRRSGSRPQVEGDLVGVDRRPHLIQLDPLILRMGLGNVARTDDDLERANLADRREAATSELALVLHTREAATKEEDEGGAAGAARNARDFLAAAGTIALFLLIVLSPVVLLQVLLWLAFRARSRRVEARLLDRTDPASPPSA